MRPSSLLLRLAILAPLAACSGGHDGHADASESVNCALETTADDFVIGLAKVGDAGVLRFELMSLTPAPPARGDNEWVLQVTAPAGNPTGSPVAGATIFVTPFMPKHQHGTPIIPVIEPMTTAGQYKISRVNLWMPGLWETSVEVSSASGDDATVFRVCIPG